jgi:hypothetical protein
MTFKLPCLRFVYVKLWFNSTKRLSETQMKSILCKIWGFHSGDYEECRLLGCDAVWTEVSEEYIASIFRVEISASEKTAWSGGSLAYISTMNMEVICSSETSIHTRSTCTTSQKTELFMKLYCQENNYIIIIIIIINNYNPFSILQSRLRRHTHSMSSCATFHVLLAQPSTPFNLFANAVCGN